MAHPKRRAFQHIMEEGSDAILRSLMPSEWVLRHYKPDYGLDFALELFDYVDAEQKIHAVHNHVRSSKAARNASGV